MILTKETMTKLHQGSIIKVRLRAIRSADSRTNFLLLKKIDRSGFISVRLISKNLQPTKFGTYVRYFYKGDELIGFRPVIRL